jgi:Zn-dependent protease
MNGWWITESQAVFGTAFIVSWIVWVVLSVVLHELSHGWAALALGDDTPRATGHMTWNPMVHMGGFSLLALLLIGIAWGMMPINPSRLRGRHGDAIVSAAGPAMNIVLFVASSLACVAWVVLGDHFGVRDPLYKNLVQFFYVGAFLNIALAAFNLIPAPPLDGSRILASFVPAYDRMLRSPNGQWIGLGIFVLIFMMGGSYLFGFSRSVSTGFIEPMLTIWNKDLWAAMGF